MARLLFDSFSNNTGDVAIGIANHQLLSARGITAETSDPFDVQWNSTSPLLIGGGELIRPRGTVFYDAFRVAGPHILNAVGVWTNADALDFAAGYSHVSARSSVEAEVLRRAGIPSDVLPCSTTCLESPDFPMQDWSADEDEPLVGIHLVPHALRTIDYLVPLVSQIPYRKVFFSFTPYIRDLQFMEHLPFDAPDAIYLGGLAPLELHALIRRLRFVFVSSLHASIFAYSQNVPFVSVGQKKVHYYFSDRGLDRFVVDDFSSAKEALTEAAEGDVDFSQLVADDAALVHEAFDKYADIFRAAQQSSELNAASGPSAGVSPKAMLQAQDEHIIRDRDAVIGGQVLRLAQLDENYRETLLELDKIRRDQEASISRVAQIESELSGAVTQRDALRETLGELRARPFRTIASHLMRKARDLVKRQRMRRPPDRLP